jgi:hypothetical protein
MKQKLKKKMFGKDYHGKIDVTEFFHRCGDKTEA